MSDLEKTAPDATAAKPREPVFYITAEKSLVGNEIHEAGARVAYDGLPAENLKPTCPEGERRYQEYLESNKARVAAMMEKNQGDNGLNGPEFIAEMARMQAKLAEQNAVTIATAVGEAVAKALANFTPATSTPVVEAAPAPAAAEDAPAVDTKKPAKG